MDKLPLGIFHHHAGVKPGTWREVSAEDLDNIRKASTPPVKPKLQTGNLVIQALRIFIDVFNPKTDLVLYPCCGVDANPAKAFGNEQVLHIDLDQTSYDLFSQEEYKIIQMDIHEYHPGNNLADILILFNPATVIDDILEFVKVDGYVLCNNYHCTADQIKDDFSDKFQFLGVIIIDPIQNKTYLDQKELGKFWQEVSTEDELKKARFSWGSANYNFVVTEVKSRFRNLEDLIRQYKDVFEIVNKPDENGLIVDFLPQLPSKKGTVDDLFIFQRVK